jgi:hypothetical protein
MPTVTIQRPNDPNETISKTTGYTYTRTIGEMYKLKVTVAREDAQGIGYTKGTDTLDLSGVTSGTLVDVNRQGATWTFIAYSPEWDAKKEPPIDGGNKWDGSDKDLVNQAINNVSAWSTGTVNELKTGLTFIFNQAFYHEILRRIEQNVPGEIQFASDGTVDYVDTIGTDKTGSVTLSPSNGNLKGQPEIQERGRKYNETHFRVTGAHEGEAQPFANLVPSGDGGTYDNKVTYSAGSRWSNSSDTEWGRYENNDVQDQSTIEAEAEALGSELGDDLLEVKAAVSTSVGLALGDRVTLEDPNQDIPATEVRVRKLRTKADGSSVVDIAWLSTRFFMRRDEEAELRKNSKRTDIGYEGASVTVMGGGGRRPAGDVDYIDSFRYPNIQFENKAEMLVRGFPYQAFSKGSAAGAGTIENEIPFDISESTSDHSGGSRTIRDTMTYPRFDTGSFDPVLYDTGDGASDWSEGTAAATGNNSSVAHSTETNHLNVTATASDDGSGDPQFEADGNWSYTTRFDMSDYATLEIEWAATFTNPTAASVTEVVAMVGGGIDDPASVNEASISEDDTTQTDGFARKTDTLDISSVDTRERVRMAARAITEAGDADAVSDLEVYRAEVKT